MPNTITEIESYTIHSWMRTELNLKGNKRDIYAIIYQQSQGGCSYNGTAQALANVVGISKRQVLAILGELVKEGLLIKKEHFVNRMKFCEYWAAKRGGEKTSSPVKKNEKTGEVSSPVGGEETSPFIYIYNTSTNNTTSINNIKYSSKKESEEKPKRKTFNEIVNESLSDEKVKRLIFDYIQMRILNKRKLTNTALELVIKSLKELSSDPKEQVKILENSIRNSWIELYPLAKPKQRNDLPGAAEPKKTGFNNFSQRTNFDYKALEQKLLLC